MSSTAKDMDQQFKDLDVDILADKPDEPDVDDAKLDMIDDLLSGKEVDNDDKTQDQDNEQEDKAADLGDEGEADADDAQDKDDDADADDDTTEPDQVDYDIEVPMPEEMEPLTVGELKDRETNRQQRERKIEKNLETNLQTSVDLDSIIGTLARLGQLPQETVATITAVRQASIVRENKATLEVIPDWKDNKVFIADHEMITTLAAKFGYTSAEVRAATDHRLIHAFREFALLQNKVDSAKALPDKKINRKQTGRKARKLPGAKIDKLVDAAAKSDNKAFKDATIAKLLE